MEGRLGPRPPAVLTRRPGRKAEGEQYAELWDRIQSGRPLSLGEYAHAAELLDAPSTRRAQEAALWKRLVFRVQVARGPAGLVSESEIRCEPRVSLEL